MPRTAPAPSPVAMVTPKGARRWAFGHPWIYRSDVSQRPEVPAGAVLVEDSRGKPLGWALWSPASEIALRLVDRNPEARVDAQWWHARLSQAVARRAPLLGQT